MPGWTVVLPNKGQRGFHYKKDASAMRDRLLLRGIISQVVPGKPEKNSPLVDEGGFIRGTN